MKLMIDLTSILLENALLTEIGLISVPEMNCEHIEKGRRGYSIGISPSAMQAIVPLIPINCALRE